MPSTYSIRFRLNYQAPGENLNTWGTLLNNNVFQLLEDAVAKRVAFALSGPKTLTVANGAADEARCAFLDVTGGTGGTITTTQTEKLTLVRNNSSGPVILTTADITPGRADATVEAGDLAWCACDAVNWRLVSRTSFAGSRLKNIADGVAATDAASKGQVDTVAANLDLEEAARITGDAATLYAAQVYADQLALAASSGAFPAPAGRDWLAVVAVGGVLTWQPHYGAAAVPPGVI